VLATAGADLLACETLPCLAEARALARLLPEFPEARAWISFSCRDDGHTSQGEPFADCVAAFDAHPQVVAIGLNCSAPAHVPALLASARSRTAKPLLAYPNSGEQYDAAGKRWLGCADHHPFAEQAAQWVAAGARVVGGCCRTSPEDIAALRTRLLGRPAASP
jgi:homocysteine S-methyltransferase